MTGELPAMEGHHAHPSDHVSHLVEQHVTLQGALLVSVLRVLFGVAVGGPLGILAGFVMGWSRTRTTTSTRSTSSCGPSLRSR